MPLNRGDDSGRTLVAMRRRCPRPLSRGGRISFLFYIYFGTLITGRLIEAALWRFICIKWEWIWHEEFQQIWAAVLALGQAMRVYDFQSGGPEFIPALTARWMIFLGSPAWVQLVCYSLGCRHSEPSVYNGLCDTCAGFNAGYWFYSDQLGFLGCRKLPPLCPGIIRLRKGI